MPWSLLRWQILDISGFTELVLGADCPFQFTVNAGYSCALQGLQPPEILFKDCKADGDVNQDGELSISDVALIAQVVAQVVPTLEVVAVVYQVLFFFSSSSFKHTHACVYAPTFVSFLCSLSRAVALKKPTGTRTEPSTSKTSTNSPPR